MKQLAKKNIYLARFLTCVNKSQVLRSAPFYVDFLKETNQDEFTLKAMGTSLESGPKKLFDIATLSGEIDVNAKKSAINFCDNMEQWTDQYQEINKL